MLRETNDGFIIAQRDLELRGPGELLGTRQTGLADLKIADLVRDQPLIQVQKMARFLMDRHPDHVEPLIRRWLGLRDHYSMPDQGRGKDGRIACWMNTRAMTGP